MQNLFVGKAAIRASGLISPAARSVKDSLDVLRSESTGGSFGASTFATDELGAASGLARRAVRKVDRFSLLAVAAARQALQQGKLQDQAQEECGVITGNMLAGWTFTEPQLRALHGPGLAAVDPNLATAWFPAAAQGQITIHLGLKGYAKTLTTDHCAGAQAIGMAFERISSGRGRYFLCGGVEAPVTPLVEAAFELSASRPRLAEAAAYLLLGPAAKSAAQSGVEVRAHWTHTQSKAWTANELAGRVAAFLEAIRAPQPIHKVVCSGVPRSAEQRLRAALDAALGARSEVLFADRVYGATLAASSAIAAVLAHEWLAQLDASDSVLVLAASARSLDLLWLYRRQSAPDSRQLEGGVHHGKPDPT